MPANIKELVGFKGGALLLRRKGGSIGSAVIVDALGRFEGDGRGARGVDLDGRPILAMVVDTDEWW
jgi:hypothetical protein